MGRLKESDGKLDECTAPELRQSDEVFCPTCKMRWDAHEPKPPCPYAKTP